MSLKRNGGLVVSGLLLCATVAVAQPPDEPKAQQGAAQQGVADNAKLVYPTADIVVEYRDAAGRSTRDLQKFRIEDAGTVAEIASHCPGILAARGSGPQTSAGKKAKFTIIFHPQGNDVAQVRVAHFSGDYATWWWRDNPPYTGERQVAGKAQFQLLMEQLAVRHRVILK